MWGYANVRNRDLANWLFILLTDQEITNGYNRNKVSKKGRDQRFLKDYYWPIALENSTIHASYFCNNYGNKIPARPFPTQRPEYYCFVPCSYCCNKDLNNKIWKEKCSSDCRPKDHQNWTYC